ncbi:RidA family protein [Spirulina sp. CS-785/01]|uniref:RidA family protein n=1 Tax=Spirulina sp. CS-785/01 TaxID=3021716 RepID=UPI00232ABC69|nr:RidA family protein [Spirulina sp. CS-785/01]MDB9311649.1 RidA family protein [Spirulina sp. CS-785/01]
MSKTVIHTPNAPAPVGPYNQAIVASGQMIFVSGQIPLDPQTGEFVGSGDISQQTQQVMQNVQGILEASGVTWENVVKMTIYLTDLSNFGTVNQIYGQYFQEDSAPARACVEVAGLPKGALVEMECIAIA